jgi:hypothetical protein
MSEGVVPVRARRSKSDWLALFDAQAQSGLSQRRFCAAQGVSFKAFANARSRYREESSAGVRSNDFVPLVLSPPGAERRDALEVELSLGGEVVLRIVRR